MQTMKSIAVRFQNRRVSEHDPLASFDIAPLYPLNNLLWGYIQDEQHRLTVPRRNYEYDHHYGIALDGRAVPALRSADSRSKFLEAFHNLLHRSLLFFKLDDDTTVKADAFLVLQALKEVHLLLREGQVNAFGDLPSTSRLEMLMEQWILARPEMAHFLAGRPMTPYSEAWMDRVDTMKKLKGWTDVSVIYFNDLAKFGEMLLLSIRHGNWSNIPDAAFAAHWARDWRPQIQQYVAAYRTVTGVDLSPELTDVRLASDRYVQPSVHLRKRLDAQLRGAAPSAETGSQPRIAGAGGVPHGRNSSTPIGSASSRHAGDGIQRGFLNESHRQCSTLLRRITSALNTRAVHYALGNDSQPGFQQRWRSPLRLPDQPCACRSARLRGRRFWRRPLSFGLGLVRSSDGRTDCALYGCRSVSYHPLGSATRSDATGRRCASFHIATPRRLSALSLPRAGRAPVIVTDGFCPSCGRVAPLGGLRLTSAASRLDAGDR